MLLNFLLGIAVILTKKKLSKIQFKCRFSKTLCGVPNDTNDGPEYSKAVKIHLFSTSEIETSIFRGVVYTTSQFH